MGDDSTICWWGIKLIYIVDTGEFLDYSNHGEIIVHIVHLY